MSYPKHICYRQGGVHGTQMHAVARDENEEEKIREMVSRRGHRIMCCQPIEEMEERERRQFIECEEVGFRKTYHDSKRDREREPSRENRPGRETEPELPF